jgi:type IV secretion system protein VirB5
VTDLGSAVSALGALGIQNPLPVNPYAVQGLMNGSGGTSGMLANLGSLYTGTLGANRVYQTNGDGWMAKQINANGGGLAGAQALALQLYQSAAQRIPLLNALQSRISTVSDPSEREALIARLGAEQAYIQNANVQANALGNYMLAQFQVVQQHRAERLQQDIDAVLQDAKRRGIW